MCLDGPSSQQIVRTELACHTGSPSTRVPVQSHNYTEVCAVCVCVCVCVYVCTPLHIHNVHTINVYIETSLACTSSYHPHGGATGGHCHSLRLITVVNVYVCLCVCVCVCVCVCDLLTHSLASWTTLSRSTIMGRSVGGEATSSGRGSSTGY